MKQGIVTWCQIEANRLLKFARRGAPEVLIYDNGRQFVRREFRESMQRWDFENVANRLKNNLLKLVSILYNGVP